MLEKYALFKVIKGLLTQDKEVSIRELARKLKIGSGTAKIQLDYLFENKLVKKKIIGKNHLYKLDTENVITRQIKILNSLLELQKARLVEEILEKYKDVLSILLYGSVSIGIDDSKSDLDILIITRKPIRLTHLKAEDKMKREITFIIYSLMEWKKKAKENKVFYDNVILNSINLYGEKPVVL